MPPASSTPCVSATALSRIPTQGAVSRRRRLMECSFHSSTKHKTNRGKHPSRQPSLLLSSIILGSITSPFLSLIINNNIHSHHPFLHTPPQLENNARQTRQPPFNPLFKTPAPHPQKPRRLQRAPPPAPNHPRPRRPPPLHPPRRQYPHPHPNNPDHIPATAAVPHHTALPSQPRLHHLALPRRRAHPHAAPRCCCHRPPQKSRTRRKRRGDDDDDSLQTTAKKGRGL